MKKYLFALTTFIFTAMVTTSSHSALINIERYEHKNVGKAVGCPDGYLMSKPQGKLCTTTKVKGISCYKDCYCDGSKGYIKVAGTDSCKCKDGWEQKSDGTCEKITCTKDEDLIDGKCVSCSTFPRIDCPSDRGTYRHSEKCGACRYTECKKGNG